MSHVDSELAGLLRSIDLATLGTRVRNARLAKGLTQSEVAAGDASTAYISRIESGHRRPDGRLLEKIAARLDTTLEQLLHGIDASRKAELTLNLDYAELSLASGQPEDTLTRTAEVLEQDGPPELHGRARHLRAAALESSGDLDAAINAFEELVSAPTGGLDWLVAAIALSRCYRESGDLARAIDIGESAMGKLEEYALAGSDEAVQLAVTLAAAHFERGDISHAIRLCNRAIEQAELLDSPRAKASAYWNASVMESNQGRVDAAVSLAKKAVALLELDSDNRNLARLRSQLGFSQLRLDPPALADAQANLERAERELEWSSASPVDTARNRLGLARARYLAGDLDDAAERATAVIDDCRELPLLSAWARALLGQVLADQQDLDGAKAAYIEAIQELTAAGSDRNAAQLWFELGGLLEEIGAATEAMDAYRRAAASTGLTPRIASRTTV
jgi:tetratricopeptide (TPR) repeat protein